MHADHPSPEKTVTVITVCRNSAATIRRTIESVLAQKDPQVEYLIIDGGSTDGTLEIVRSFGSRVDTVLSEADGGIADAFNKGIRLARGGLVALVNADDALLPGALPRVVAYFREHPGTAVVHGDVLLYAGEQFVKRLRPAGSWWHPWRLVLFNHPATFVRREVYQVHGLFDPDIAIAMDVEIFLRWMKNGVPIGYLPEPLARMAGGGVSGRRAREGFLEVRRALVGHGFSPTLARLQFWGKCLVHSLIGLSGRWRAP